MATQSSILAWRTPWAEEPDRLQSMGSQRVEHDLETSTFNTVQYSIAYRVSWVPQLTWTYEQIGLMDTFSEQN